MALKPLCALVSASILFAAPAARAQGNYNSVALGGRSALMGDTGIAIGTDGAAPFLNPATVVRVESTLALSVSILSVDFLHASNWYAQGADISRVSGNAVPSTFCLFFALPEIFHPEDKDSHAGTQKLAACFGTTELQQFDWVGQGFQSGSPGTIETSSVRWNWQRFAIGPTYAVNVTDSFALGASLQGVFTNFSSFASVGSVATDGTTASVFQDGASGSDFGLTASLGATLAIDRTTLGASIQSPDFSIYGHGNISDYVTTGGVTSTYIGQGGFHGREPARFGVGLGYEWPRGKFEVDGHLALADGHAVELDMQGTQLANGVSAASAVTRTTRFQPTVNFGAGLEYFVRPTLSLLGGFATDFSAVDGLLPTSVAQSQVNRLLVSFGVGSHNEAGTLVIGTQAYYGWGSMLGYANAPVVAPTSVSSFGFLFVLAGATNFRAIQRALDEMKKAVTPPGNRH